MILNPVRLTMVTNHHKCVLKDQGYLSSKMPLGSCPSSHRLLVFSKGAGSLAAKTDSDIGELCWRPIPQHYGLRGQPASALPCLRCKARNSDSAPVGHDCCRGTRVWIRRLLDALSPMSPALGPPTPMRAQLGRDSLGHVLERASLKELRPFSC